MRSPQGTQTASPCTAFRLGVSWFHKDGHLHVIYRHRHRRLIALLGLLGMLFQQIALAVYVCPIEQQGIFISASTSSPCHEQGGDSARCHTHCHSQLAPPDHPPALTVPAAVLPPTTWLRAASRQADSFRNELRYEVAARATAPPLTIQHCTFQI